MLSIGKCRDGRYYLDLAAEDYYLKGGEPPGLWYGRGAALLGLKGRVEDETFLKLWDGYGPEGQVLRKNAGRNEPYILKDGTKRYPQRAWDFTFSAPKSVSLMWALADEETSRKILEAHERAVRAGLNYLERQAGFTRIGQGGQTLVQADMVFATFQHSTSRAQDVNLHTHCLAFNAAIQREGERNSGTLYTSLLYREKMAAGALYQAALAREMLQLGFETVQEKSFGFEIRGVPKPVRDFFSKRAEQIQDALSEKGIFTAKAAQLAALDTREWKDLEKHLPRQQLKEITRNLSQELGFGPEKARSLQTFLPGFSNPDRAALHLARQGIQEITEQNAHFTRRDLVRYVGTRAPLVGAGPEEIEKAADTALQKCVPVGRFRDEEQFTTPGVINLESRFLQTAERMKDRAFRPVTQKIRESVSRFESLSTEQRQALEVLTNGRSLSIVSGVAGAGKGYLLGATREAFEQAGCKVVGLAPSGVARNGLKDEDIKSFTIAKAFHEWEKAGFQKATTLEVQDNLAQAAGLMSKKEAKFWDWQRERAPLFELSKKHVILVDEAGMCDTVSLARILDKAERTGAKVCLIGDPDQLPPIQAGTPFRALIERTRKEDRAHLTDIIRQREDWQKRATLDIRAGRATEAFSAYAAKGHLHFGATRESAKTALIDAWLRDGAPKNSLMLAPTNKEVSELNRIAQDKRRDELGPSSIRLGSDRMYERDRILFTSNNNSLGLTNGDFGTITQVNTLTRRMTVSLDSGREISFSTRKYDDFQLGYAATVHKAQGATVDRSYVLLGDTMQDRQLSYVQLSRHRDNLELFVDRETAGKEFRDVLSRMEKAQDKRLAHDIPREQQARTPELDPEREHSRSLSR